LIIGVAAPLFVLQLRIFLLLNAENTGSMVGDFLLKYHRTIYSY